MRVFLVFEAGTSFSDRAIQLLEERLGDGMAAPHPLASHVWLCLILDDGTMIGVEAVPPQVRRFDPLEKAGQVLRAYEVPATQEQALAIHDAALALVGRPYSFDAVAGALLSLVEHKPETFWRDAGKRFDCIEAVATCVRSAGIPFCGDTPAYDLSPSGGEVDAAAHWPRVIRWLPAPAPTLPDAA